MVEVYNKSVGVEISQDYQWDYLMVFMLIWPKKNFSKLSNFTHFDYCIGDPLSYIFGKMRTTRAADQVVAEVWNESVGVEISQDYKWD